jgi:uncharacterized membrane protein
VILLTWPVHGVVAIFKEIIRQAEDALYDEDALHAELRFLHGRLEAGEMNEEEFERRENELAERLVLAAQYNRSRPRVAR